MCFGERIEEGAHWNRTYSVQGLFIGFSPTFEVSKNNSKEITEHTMSEKKNTPRKKRTKTELMDCSFSWPDLNAHLLLNLASFF